MGWHIGIKEGKVKAKLTELMWTYTWTKDGPEEMHDEGGGIAVGK